MQDTLIFGRSLHRLSGTLLLSLTLVGPLASLAQSADKTSAEVRRVDREAGKITLRHGEIKNLDMPPMTMVFQVRDPTLLDKLKAGDKVLFTADKAGGSYIVLTIEPQP
jgi:Cu/Ag efflux protein CusF